MLSHEIYEKLSNIISQSALNSLSDTQVEALEEELSSHVQEKMEILMKFLMMIFLPHGKMPLDYS